jgi:hypothetical protein
MSERAARRRAEREATKNRLPADARYGACEGCGKYKACDVTYRICGRCQFRFLEMAANLVVLRQELAAAEADRHENLVAAIDGEQPPETVSRFEVGE